jgi:hypothetical protein
MECTTLTATAAENNYSIKVAGNDVHLHNLTPADGPSAISSNKIEF